MRETYRIGNAQSIGSYQVQSNYFSTKRNETGTLSVLADGTIDHINGRRCAVLATEICMQVFCSLFPDIEPGPLFDTVERKVLQEMRTFLFLGKTPYLSLSMQWISHGELFYYTVGQNRAFLFDGRDFKWLAERSGSVTIRRGMTAGLISCGVYEALHEREMVAYLREKGHPYGRAQQMIAGVRDKNRKKAGNATVVLVEVCL